MDPNHPITDIVDLTDDDEDPPPPLPFWKNGPDSSLLAHHLPLQLRFIINEEVNDPIKVASPMMFGNQLTQAHTPLQHSIQKCDISDGGNKSRKRFILMSASRFNHCKEPNDNHHIFAENNPEVVSGFRFVLPQLTPINKITSVRANPTTKFNVVSVNKRISPSGTKVLKTDNRQAQNLELQQFLQKVDFNEILMAKTESVLKDKVKDRCMPSRSHAKRRCKDTLERGFSVYERNCKRPNCTAELPLMYKKLRTEIIDKRAKIDILNEQILNSRRIDFEPVFVEDGSADYLLEEEPTGDISRDSDNIQMTGISLIKQGVELLREWSKSKLNGGRSQEDFRKRRLMFSKKEVADSARKVIGELAQGSVVDEHMFHSDSDLLVLKKVDFLDRKHNVVSSITRF